MVRVGSAAWVVVVVGAVSIVIGSFLMTVIDPVAQALFGSTMFDSTTTYGNNAYRWVEDAWAFMSTAILLFVAVLVFVRTRRG